MKLKLRIHPSMELFDLHLSKDQRYREFSSKNWVAPFWLDSDSPLFEALCGFSSTGPDFRVSAAMPIVSDADQFDWYELECRKTTPMSDREFDVWSKQADGMHDVPIGNGLNLRQLERFQIGKVRGQPNEIVCPEAGPYLFLCQRSVEAILAKYQLRGARLLQISDMKGQPHDWYALQAEKYLPPSPHHLCAKTVQTGTSIQIDRRIALAYRKTDLDTLSEQDFAFTSEHYGDWLPRLITSKRVASAFKSHNINGVAYYPIFEVGTESYESLLAEVSRVRQLVAMGEGNKWR